MQAEIPSAFKPAVVMALPAMLGDTHLIYSASVDTIKQIELRSRR